MRERRHGEAGVSRAAMVLAGAVVAAVVVLLMGALRSGLPATPVASLTASAPPGSSGLRSLPVTQTVAPTSASTPAPPDPTAISDLRGEFVGPLGHVESCPILYEREGVLELVLPDGYRSRMRSGAIEIVRADGSVVAAEGQLLGVNGKVGGGGSVCLAGPRLHVTKIVEVRARNK